MKARNTFQRLIVAAIALVILTPAGVAAQSPDTPPNALPLPDVIFYGTATGVGGPLETGTVELVLPRGGGVRAPIGQIGKNDYTYLLSIPLSMYDPDEGIYAAGSVVAGDVVSFYVNSNQALFQDDNGLTTSQFVIPENAAGQTYILNLTLTGPDAYPLGDVNASGARDAADALLVLKYDIGLIGGDETFPPTPGNIYLPLCDIVEDGRCNSSDALRILQCDVGMPGVDCPGHPGTATALDDLPPTRESALMFGAEIGKGPEDDQITVRVFADDPLAELGAASLELRYDAALLAVEACRENPDGFLDAAVCNGEFGPSVVRFNVVSTAGAGDEAALAEITFRLLDPTVVEAQDGALDGLARTLTLVADGVFDLEGSDLACRIKGRLGGQHFYLPLIVCLEGAVVDTDVLSPELDQHLYLPLVGRLEGGDVTQDIETTPEALSPELYKHLYLPLVPLDSGELNGRAEGTPYLPPQGQGHRFYLPLVSGQ